MTYLIRVAILSLIVLLALPALGAGSRRHRADGPCPGARPTGGDLGFQQVQCVGGSCSLFRLDEAGVYTHEFTVEPRVWEIRSGSPAAGQLEEGDTLVAVDGLLITTREAGRRLANLVPGQAVELRVRRDGDERDFTLVPEEGCGPNRLVSTSDPDYRGGDKKGKKERSRKGR